MAGIPYTFSPNTKLKSAEVNADFAAVPSAVDKQAEASNAALSSAKIAMGYKSVQRNSGNNIVSGTVSFPFTFQAIPIVTTSYNGSAGAASSLGTSTADGARTTEVYGISTSGFSFRIYVAAGTNWSDSTQYEYLSWIAIG